MKPTIYELHNTEHNLTLSTDLDYSRVVHLICSLVIALYSNVFSFNLEGFQGWVQLNCDTDMIWNEELNKKLSPNSAEKFCFRSSLKLPHRKATYHNRTATSRSNHLLIQITQSQKQANLVHRREHGSSFQMQLRDSTYDWSRRNAIVYNFTSWERVLNGGTGEYKY